MKITQYSLCEAYDQHLVILTNTLFNDVESILVAPIQSQTKKNIRPVANSYLAEYRTAIKAGLDLLIDGF